MSRNRILDRISSPQDLKTLTEEELTVLAGEIRELIIKTVSENGGHLAPNLGTVELTVALLKVFDPSYDKIIWDVSHQVYTYKILTDRKDKFSTLRKFGGISGYLTRSESVYDVFGAGHSGTALSAALGFAVARDRRGGKESVVAVIGDGSVGCGITFEAMNNISTLNTRLIVILNDNEMSISFNVGSMASYMGKLLANPRYNRWKSKVEIFAVRKLHLGWLRKIYYRIEEFLKSLVLKSVLFEEFGLRYIGPIDGHNIRALIDAFTVAKNSDRPIICHVNTRKGYGYRLAEVDPETWHSCEPFDVFTGKPRKEKAGLTYSEVSGSTIIKLAEEDERIVAITAAMARGTGLSEFAKRFPKRFFDVGIAEEHAAVFAAGLAAAGLRPFYFVYSTFAQRAVDCVFHDICLQNMPVVICLDRAGIVEEDGPTHHGIFDIAFFRSFPGIIIMQPGDEQELADMLFTALKAERPVVIRYPKGYGPGIELNYKFKALEIGKAKEIVPVTDKTEVSIWAVGNMIDIGKEVLGILNESRINSALVNVRFIKPMDYDLLIKHAGIVKYIVTIEDGVVNGGFGSAVMEFLQDRNLCRVVRFGWPDEIITHGKREELLKYYGIDMNSIAVKIKDLLKK